LDQSPAPRSFVGVGWEDGCWPPRASAVIRSSFALMSAGSSVCAPEYVLSSRPRFNPLTTTECNQHREFTDGGSPAPTLCHTLSKFSCNSSSHRFPRSLPFPVCLPVSCADDRPHPCSLHNQGTPLDWDIHASGRYCGPPTSGPRLLEAQACGLRLLPCPPSPPTRVPLTAF
jgi:hypothetical protein